MNFSHINFSPNNVAMHQYNPAVKVPGSVQHNVAFIPSTTTQHYQNQSNQVNFPINGQATSSAVGLQNQHHYHVSSNRISLQNGSNRHNNEPSVATTCVHSHWNNRPGIPVLNSNTRINLQLLPHKSQGNQSTLTVYKPLRVVATQDAATMTEFENIAHSKNIQKGTVSSEDSNDSFKYSSDENTYFQRSVCSNSCSKVHKKNSGSAMAEYLRRLHQCKVPPSIEEFLKSHNIKVGVSVYKTEISGVNKDFDDNSRNGSEASLRLSTALDGSLLYCCSECQIAYPHKELLERHLSVHRVERRFECNVCGVCLKRKEHLDQHKRGHSEERPFVCEICCKGFKRNEHLRRHIVIHSGNRSHVCTQCGKAFSRKDHLTKHLQTHVNKQAKNEVNDPVSPLAPVQTTNNNQKIVEQTFSPKQISN